MSQSVKDALADAETLRANWSHRGTLEIGRASCRERV